MKIFKLKKREEKRRVKDISSIKVLGSGCKYCHEV